MENSYKENKIHYAWWILVACCIMQFGGLGIIVNAGTIFLPAIKENLGFTTGEYSTYIMFHQFAQALMLPISGRILSNAKDNKSILFSAIGVLISNAILVLLTEPWQWYIAGAIRGVFGAFLYMTLAPMVLKRWFKKKAAFAVGLSSAFSGIGGALISPVGVALIEQQNWQFSMLALTAMAGIALIPSTLFLLKLRPEYMGLKPYGAEEDEVTVTNEKAEIKEDIKASIKIDMTFLLVMLFGVLLSTNVGFNPQTIQIAISLGLTTMAASFVVSASMIGNIVCKLLIGFITERFNSFYALVTVVIMVMLGLLGYIVVGGSSLIVMLISGFLYGGCMALNAVGLPLLVGDFYTGKEYDMVLSYAMMFSMIIIGISMMIVGTAYDIFGTYIPLMVIGIGIYTFMIFMLSILYRRKRAS